MVYYPSSYVTIRFTYLDSELNGGRPVVILRARNLVEEHDQQVVISYRFERSRMYVEPAMLVASFFAFFVLCMLLARTSGITKTTSSTKKASSSGDLNVGADKKE